MCDSGFPVGIDPTIFRRARIDRGDGILQLGADVEKTILRTEHRAMRTHTLAEIQIANNLARCDVDDDEIASVGSRLSYAGVSVDRNVRKFSVRRGDHLMSGNSTFRNGRDLLTRFRIDDAERVLALVGDRVAFHVKRKERACPILQRLPTINDRISTIRRGMFDSLLSRRFSTAFYERPDSTSRPGRRAHDSSDKAVA